MMLLRWFLIILVGIIISDKYHGRKWILLVVGFLLVFFSLDIVGAVLVCGTLVAYIITILREVGIPVFNIENLVIDYLNIYNYKNERKEFLKIVKEIDNKEFTNPDEVVDVIQELSNKIDRKKLSTKEINILRRKNSELWEKYYKLRKSPYDVLGVAATATQEKIKHVYIELCKKYHPDLNRSKYAENKFKEIQEAYNTIKNKKK